MVDTGELPTPTQILEEITEQMRAPSQFIGQEEAALEAKYVGLWLKMKAIGSIALGQDDAIKEYELGIASGYHLLRKTGQDEGSPRRRLTPIQDTPVVDSFYRDTLNGLYPPKDKNVWINEQIENLERQNPNYHSGLNRLSIRSKNTEAFMLGASLIQFFSQRNIQEGLKPRQ